MMFLRLLSSIWKWLILFSRLSSTLILLIIVSKRTPSNLRAGTRHPIWLKMLRRPMEYSTLSWVNEFTYLWITKDLVCYSIYRERSSDNLWNFYMVQMVLKLSILMFWQFRFRRGRQN